MQSNSEGQSPLLPFAEGELLAVRLLPAEFSRVLGVSKQSVSRWIKSGKVTVGCDGRINPNEGMRQLLRNGDPGRIRARLIRSAVSDLSELRAQVSQLEILEKEMEQLRQALAVERKRLAMADADYDILEAVHSDFKNEIANISLSVRQSYTDDSWRMIIKAVEDQIWGRYDLRISELEHS